MELIIVTVMIGILIPLTGSLILDTYDQYVRVSIINRLSASADNSLRSVTKDITIMNQIKKANDTDLYFTLIGVGERYYRFDDVTNSFQLCMTSCVNGEGDPIAESFGTLTKNLDIENSGFEYYEGGKKTRKEGEHITIINPLMSGFQNALPAAPSAPELLVGYVKVILGLRWDDVEIPIHSIVRPAVPY